MVRKGGVEPPRPCGHTVLSRTRLPIPPLPRFALSYIIRPATRGSPEQPLFLTAARERRYRFHPATKDNIHFKSSYLCHPTSLNCFRVELSRMPAVAYLPRTSSLAKAGHFRSPNPTKHYYSTRDCRMKQVLSTVFLWHLWYCCRREFVILFRNFYTTASLLKYVLRNNRGGIPIRSIRP